MTPSEVGQVTLSPFESLRNPMSLDLCRVVIGRFYGPHGASIKYDVSPTVFECWSILGLKLPSQLAT